MDRRAFLRRLGVTAAALAVAPAAAAQLLERSAEPRVPTTYRVYRGSAEHGYELVPYDEWPTSVMECMTATSVHTINTRGTVREWESRLC